MFQTTRHSVGSDILLARHGSAISSMRFDRAGGQIVARLQDGSFDTAPNLIDPSLNMPGSVDEETRIIVIAFIAAVALSLFLTVAVAAIYAMASPEQLESMTSMMAGYTPAM
ncbi:hypothetical protein [Arthrobacter psychrolactophilus]